MFLPLAVSSRKIHSEIRLRLVFDARNAVTRHELRYILYYMARERERYAHSRFTVNYNKYLWYIDLVGYVRFVINVIGFLVSFLIIV